MAKTSKRATVFTREATGLVREASFFDAFVFNTAVCGGLGFVVAWGLAWMLYAFPGADMWLALLIGMVFCIPTAVTFALLSAAIPRTGGEYVFVSRILHPALGFVSNWCMWVSNIICVGLAGLFVVTLALGPSLAGVGYAGGGQSWIDLGSLVVEQTWIWILGGIFIIAIGVLMSLGAKRLFRIENVSFVIAMIGLVITALILLFASQGSFVANFNEFAGPYTGQADSYNHIIQLAADNGFDLPQGHPFDRTFGAVVIAMGILGYTFWSTYIGGEIKGAANRNRQIWLLLGSLIFLAFLFMAVFGLLFKTFGYDFFSSIVYLADNAPDAYPLPVAPFYNLLVNFIHGNTILAIILAICFLGFAIPYTVPIIGMLTRCLFAWAFDGVIPRKIADVDEQTHSPVWAIAIVVVVGLFFLWATSTEQYWQLLAAATLVTYPTLILTAIAGALFPYRRKELYEASPANVSFAGMPLISISGVLMVLIQVMVVALYFVFPSIGLQADQAIIALVGTIALGLIIFYIAWYVRKSRGRRPQVCL